MKITTMLFVFTTMAFLLGCQETTKKKSSSSSDPYGCRLNPYNPGCSTGGVTSGSQVDCSGTRYWTVSGCQGFAYCQTNPTYPSCSGSTTGTTGGTTGTGTNPFPNYGSYYADKNWQVKYPYVPALNCSTPVTPSGIDYTPYETRKGTVTVIGAGFGPGKDPTNPKAWYDPNAYVTISGDQTSPLLRNVTDAKKFFWTDSALKIRFKANLQPDSSQSNPICAGRIPQARIKGYSRLRFQLFLVGIKADNSTTEESLGEQTIDINKCTPAIDLTSHNGVNYPSKYPNGIYLKIKNVQGNQNWAPGTYQEQQAFDTWGFYPNSFYNGGAYMPAIRSNDCWSVDIEVAADGTKTF